MRRSRQSDPLKIHRYFVYLGLIILYLIYLYYSRQMPQPASEEENPLEQGKPVEEVRQLPA